MKMKKLLVALLFAPFIAHADGFLPSQEVTVSPMREMNIPESLKHELMKRKAEEKSKGFYEKENRYAKELLNIPHTASKEIAEFKSNNNPYDTHLKSKLSQVKIAFPFKFTTIKDEDKIGYAVGGTYLKKSPDNNVSQEGWTGIKVFFKAPKIGICSYSFFDLKLSHGKVELSAETTEQIVDKKESSKTVEGTPSTGFLYSVDWYTKDTMQMLECANKVYDKEIIDKVIALANKIDKQ